MNTPQLRMEYHRARLHATATPIKLAKPFDGMCVSASGDAALFCAVIARAWDDAIGASGTATGYTPADRVKACQWFNDRVNRHRRAVCELAGVSESALLLAWKRYNTKGSTL